VTTAFVLSGGGSLGAVQVGMLQALAGEGVEPDLLVGTSVGAMNAAWVASHGMSESSLDRLARVWTGMRRRDVFPVDVRTALGGVLGRRPGLIAADRLGQLVRRCAGIGTLEETTIPRHLVAADLLSGHTVTISTGPLVTGVLASAAVPGVFAPVLRRGRHLVDGGVGHQTGVGRAVELGATSVYVLPTGAACAMPMPPSSALGTALHALTLLIEQRLARDVAACAAAATVKVLPPLCPLGVSPVDFTRARELIHRSRRAAADWIDSGAIDLPQPERFLANHGHRDGAVPSSHRPGRRRVAD
jgi:NTE family protein